MGNFLDKVKNSILNESGWYYGATTLYESVLESGITGVRVLKTPDEFIDLMTNMPGNNKFVSIGYISGANLNMPKYKKINPKTNRPNSFDDYDEFGRQLGYENGVGGVIKFTRYLLNFNTAKEMGVAYGKYKDAANNIRKEYGLEDIKDKGGYTEKIEYGPNGLPIYSGNNPEKQGHMYTPQNIFSAVNQNDSNPLKRRVSSYFIVGKDGNIIKECSKQEANDIFTRFGKNSSSPYSPEVNSLLKSIGGSDSGLTALRKADADEETMKNYLSRIKELKFIYKTFEYSSVVYMVGTVEGEKFVYINESLTRKPSSVGVDVNPQTFVDMAKKKYEKTLNELGQMALYDKSNHNVDNNNNNI